MPTGYRKISRRKPVAGSPVVDAQVRLKGRYADFMEGRLTAEDITDEEILRGRLMNINGQFNGRPPAVIPQELVQLFVEQRPKRIAEMLDKEIPHAFKALHDVMVGGTANKGGGAKVAAATKILEYAIGKPSEQVNLRVSTDDKRWEDILPIVFHEVEATDAEVVED